MQLTFLFLVVLTVYVCAERHLFSRVRARTSHHNRHVRTLESQHRHLHQTDWHHKSSFHHTQKHRRALPEAEVDVLDFSEIMNLGQQFTSDLIELQYNTSEECEETSEAIIDGMPDLRLDDFKAKLAEWGKQCNKTEAVQTLWNLHEKEVSDYYTALDGLSAYYLQRKALGANESLTPIEIETSSQKLERSWDNQHVVKLFNFIRLTMIHEDWFMKEMENFPALMLPKEEKQYWVKLIDEHGLTEYCRDHLELIHRFAKKLSTSEYMDKLKKWGKECGKTSDVQAFLDFKKSGIAGFDKVIKLVAEYGVQFMNASRNGKLTFHQMRESGKRMMQSFEHKHAAKAVPALIAYVFEGPKTRKAKFDQDRRLLKSETMFSVNHEVNECDEGPKYATIENSFFPWILAALIVQSFLVLAFCVCTSLTLLKVVRD